MISLILLVMLTLFVLTVINTTNVNSRIAGNMQVQTEAKAAAQQGIEQTISTNFTTNPLAAAVAVDVNNDGVTDYTANVAAPQCTAVIPVRSDELIYTKPSDKDCYTGQGNRDFGTYNPAAAPTDTYCSRSFWDISSNVTDAASGANVTVHQGVEVRVAVGFTSASCP